MVMAAAAGPSEDDVGDGISNIYRWESEVRWEVNDRKLDASSHKRVTLNASSHDY
jgi:hypothetical protein